MKHLYYLLVLLSSNALSQAATQWPVEVTTKKSLVTVYKPLPEHVEGDVLSVRATLSVRTSTRAKPDYGTIRLEARIEKDAEAHEVLIQDVLVDEVRVAGLETNLLHQVKVALARGAADWIWTMAEDEFNAMLVLGRSKQAAQESSSTGDIVDLNVEYDGAPRFVPIDQTTLRYAENSAFQVIHDGSRYYCADRGVWFVANHPEGPWLTTREVPKQMQRIPDSSPMQNVRFLHASDLTGSTNGYVILPGYLDAPRRWHRLHDWALDYKGQGHSIKINPYHIEYRETPEKESRRSTKKWERNLDKFPKKK